MTRLATIGLTCALTGATAHAATLTVPDAYATIQEAIDAAAAGDTIEVAPGTYVETLDFAGKDVVLLAMGGPARTIIDAAGASNVVRYISGETSASVLDGFTLTGGVAPYFHTGYNGGEQGGGILIDNASPTLRNLIIEGNEAGYCAGGIMVGDDAAPVIENTILRNNSASGFAGGALYADGPDSAPSFTNVLIYRNEAPEAAAMHSNGGAIVTMTNVTVTANRATSGFAAAAAFNTHGSHEGFADIHLTNAIVHGNTGAGPIEIAGDVFADYSLVRGGYDGTGNIDADPGFASVRRYPYFLGAGSAAIDSGTGADDGADWCALHAPYCADNTQAADMGAYGGPGNEAWFE